MTSAERLCRACVPSPTDVVSVEALTNIFARYGLIVLLEPAPFVDPLHMTLEEREHDSAEGLGGGGGGGEGGEGGEGGKVSRLFRKAVSSTKAAKEVKSLVRVAKAMAAATPSTERQGGRRSSVLGAVRGAYVFDMVRQTVKNNFLFRHLEDEALLNVVEKLREVRCEAGRIVCREGEKGDYFYIVESGVYGVYKRGELVHTYRVVDGMDKPSFGELALMYATSPLPP